MRWSQWARNSTNTRGFQRCGRIQCACGRRPANLKNRSSSCRCRHRTNRNPFSFGCLGRCLAGPGRSHPIRSSPRPSQASSTPRPWERASRSGRGHESRSPQTSCTGVRIRSATTLRRKRHQGIVVVARAASLTGHRHGAGSGVLPFTAA